MVYSTEVCGTRLWSEDAHLHNIYNPVRASHQRGECVGGAGRTSPSGIQSTWMSVVEATVYKFNIETLLHDLAQGKRMMKREPRGEEDHQKLRR